LVGRKVRQEETALLEILESATHPVGSRQATQALREQGLKLSESTVSRLLRKLDAQNLTTPVDGKGRVLTAEGRRRLETATNLPAASETLASVPDIRNARELLDLLYARRTVEREVAREAALRAQPEDIAALEELLEDHRTRLDQGLTGRGPALEFHRRIGAASRNPVLMQLTEHVLDRRLDELEAVLDVVVGAHHSEHLSVDEHAAVLAAIRAGKPDEAERAMERHVSRLIREVEEDLGSDRAGIYERFLTWMREQPREG
jgi:DNA-binding FadR family transcriptional regulator